MNSHRFKKHNLFWDSVSDFNRLDPQLKSLKQLKYVYRPDFWKQFSAPALHLLYGPRQVGKTTAIKIYISELLDKNVPPKQIFYLSCDALIDQVDLRESIQSFYETVEADKLAYLFLDEIIFVPNWALIIKSLADEGWFKNTILLITGSDSLLLQDAVAYFPGIERRGRDGMEISMLPLGFKEYLNLVQKSLLDLDRFDSNFVNLNKEFNNYLQSGGFPLAINEYKSSQSISEQVLKVYSEWIVGDFVRKNKDRRKLTAVFACLLPSMTSQVSFNSLAQKTEAISVPSFIEYIEHLDRMGVIRILKALDQNTLSGFEKKAKKIHFCDPLLWQVVSFILQEEFSIDQHAPDVVEGIAAEYYSRQYPCYYIKAGNEVDLAYVKNKSFFPIEIKWTENLRNNDLIQVKKYRNGLVLYKGKSDKQLGELPVKSLLHELIK